MCSVSFQILSLCNPEDGSRRVRKVLSSFTLPSIAGFFQGVPVICSYTGAMRDGPY